MDIEKDEGMDKEIIRESKSEKPEALDKAQLEMIFGNYVSWMTKPGTWVINFMNGSENIYLLEGNDKALLMDTGYAIGNLRRYVEKLTNKPVIVVNTHFHPDHSGGNGEWAEVMVGDGWELDATSVVRTVGDLKALPYPDYRKIVLHDGDTIDLGDRNIKIFKAQNAHCHSHLYFLDTKERIFFMGDEMDAWQVILYENSANPELEAIEDLDKTLQNYKANLLLAKSLDSEYDTLMGNHNGVGFDKSYIDDYLALVDGVYTGETTICDKLDHPFIEMDPKAPLLARIRRGKVSSIVKRELLEKIYATVSI